MVLVLHVIDVGHGAAGLKVRLDVVDVGDIVLDGKNFSTHVGAVWEPNAEECQTGKALNTSKAVGVVSDDTNSQARDCKAGRSECILDPANTDEVSETTEFDVV